MLGGAGNGDWGSTLCHQPDVQRAPRSRPPPGTVLAWATRLGSDSVRLPCPLVLCALGADPLLRPMGPAAPGSSRWEGLTAGRTAVVTACLCVSP